MHYFPGPRYYSFAFSWSWLKIAIMAARWSLLTGGLWLPAKFWLPRQVRKSCAEVAPRWAAIATNAVLGVIEPMMNGRGVVSLERRSHV